MQEINIRRAEPVDAATISALLCEFNGEALAAEVLAQRMAAARGTETVFLAELGVQPVGLIVLRIVPALPDLQDWAEITELYVAKGSRRRGAGRALVETALDYAHRRGCDEVHLLVDPKNETALAFYQALGFCQDSWEMRRRL
jgi:ribosomal protein S18 acetylase RimI-like enzyme